jgi:hypothetical protein
MSSVRKARVEISLYSALRHGQSMFPSFFSPLPCATSHNATTYFTSPYEQPEFSSIRESYCAFYILSYTLKYNKYARLFVGE